MTDRATEVRLKRAVERRGLKLIKSKRRDPRARDYGTWMIIDPAADDEAVAGDTPFLFSMTISDVEEWLRKE